MHYFSIHNQHGEHLGFMIMLPDNEDEAQPQSGRFIVKRQSETMPQDRNSFQALCPLEDLTQTFSWQKEKDCLCLYHNGEKVGTLCNEFLKIGNQTLILGDMTGAI